MSAASISCPRCRSRSVLRSHRRTAADHLLYFLGAEIRRCRECRYRHAMFRRHSVPLDNRNAGSNQWMKVLVVCSGFVFCLLFVLWVIRRFTEMSG